MSTENEEKYLKGLIKLTTALVLGLGVIMSFNLLIISTPSRDSDDDSKPTREPAGLLTPQQAGQTYEDAQERMQTLPLNCHTTKNDPRKVTAKLLRITGRDCSGFNNLHIVNQNNGISAIVFQTGPSTFTTDYFSLEKGVNKISINKLGPNGENLMREMIVHRE